jgi:hypothetical protein
MLTASDLLHLPYTPDLTEGGIAYAVRSLPYTFDRMGGSPYDRLRRIVAGVAVELAFRRYLGEQGVPFDVQGATPFTDPDRYDVSLGGHRCDLKSFLITHRRQISDMRRDPATVLDAPALVPLDQHLAEGRSDDDLYLFAFLSGVIAAARDDLQKALRAGQACCLVHVLPGSWGRPHTWAPLGPLVLKSESDAPLSVELAGQDDSRDFLSRSLTLQPHTRTVVDAPFHALSSVRADRLPGRRLGLHSPVRDETLLIAPHEWGNIWVYGMQILMAGYMQRGEFRRRARPIPPGSRVFQYDRTRARNLAVPVAQLKPLGELFESVRRWKADRR